MKFKNWKFKIVTSSFVEHRGLYRLEHGTSIFYVNKRFLCPAADTKRLPCQKEEFSTYPSTRYPYLSPVINSLLTYLLTSSPSLCYFIHSISRYTHTLINSLSFRLWIPQVRSQLHGFSFSIQLDSRHSPRWAAGPPCCAWRRRSISFSVFLYSVVHLYVCLQDPLDTIILFSPLYVPKPSQSGLPYLIRDTRYSKDATDVIISFPVPQG